MYNFVTLQLKCPICGDSLMDESRKVDHEPSVRLILEAGDRKGVIRLSSIYGSNNYLADIPIPPGELIKLFCPACKNELPSLQACDNCEAPMPYFNLDIGGRVSICSRSGCKNHLVEFSDLSMALGMLYQDYGYTGNDYPDDLDLRTNNVKSDEQVHEMLHSGTFMHTYCPHCQRSLIVDDMVKLKVHDGEEGYLMLSPYLNVFSNKSTLMLPEDELVKDIRCIHCDMSLIATDKQCGQCSSPAVELRVSTMSRIVHFYICSRKGCTWHGLSDDDYDHIRLEDSMEW